MFILKNTFRTFLYRIWISFFPLSLPSVTIKEKKMKSFLILLVAIVFETVATSCLNKSEQFTKLLPSVTSILCYAVSFYCLSVALKTMPVGIAYAIWSGVGIVLIALIGFFVFRQHLDFPAMLGLALIIAGVIVINVFSKSVSH